MKNARLLLAVAMMVGSWTLASAQDALKIGDVDKLFVEAENALCPGSGVNSCRNPTCSIDGSPKTENCVPQLPASVGGVYVGGIYLGSACQAADPRAIVISKAEKYGFAGADPNAAVKDFAALSCVYLKDWDAPDPNPDLCGTDELDKCPYLGVDKCLVTFDVHAACQNADYCGVKPATCRIVFNGVDETAVADLGKLKPFEKIAIGIFRLIHKLHGAGKISPDDGNAYLEKTVENLKNSQADELIAIQDELIAKL